MDKYEYKIRADEIKELISRGEYAQAAEIADTIDWRRVKSVMMLCTISDLYKINRRYEEARDMLLLAYERRPGGRTICYSLCELSIKTEEFVQAVEYYKEFVQVAPKDPGRYILQYRLYEAQDVSLEERIQVLEELKKRDYREKWAYELAYLYHRIGLAARCVEECDELILWFGEGKYVIKAMELKMLHQPLTAEQQRKYDSRFGAPVQEPSQEVPGGAGPGRNPQDHPACLPEEARAPRQSSANVQNADTIVYAPVGREEPENELDIQVKTVDVGLYNTMNLQAELAEGLREVLAEEQPVIQDPVTRSIMAPFMETDTETLDYPEIDEVSENDLEPEAEDMEGSEVFFGETGEIGDMTEETKVQVPDITAEIVMEQLRQKAVQEMKADKEDKEELLRAEPPKELAGVLSQESDGQLSLVMPESESLEKQITGQLSIEDVLKEWERLKRENQEKREEEIRQHVKEHTGRLFTDFEASVRDGLLEQLERERAEDQAVTAHLGEIVSMEEPAETAEIAEPEEWMEPEEAAEAEELMEPEETVEPEELIEAEEAAESEEWMEAEEIAEAEELEEPAETYDAEESLEAHIEQADETEGFADPTEPEEEEAEKEAGSTLRVLTREEKELYAPYIQTKAAKEQLIRVIDTASLAAYTGNIIITGEEGMDTLTLAKNIIRELQAADSNFSGKVAKISGGALNKKNVEETVDGLKNGALIISRASEMNSATVEALYKSLQQDTRGIIIVLEDSRKSMDRFLAENEKLQTSFTARMDVAALSNDTLVAFGRQYAYEREYSIDDFGVLALHTRIEELQTLDHAVTTVEVQDIVDEAIRHASRKTLGHFMDVLLSRRYDGEDMIILGEKDFV